MDLELAARVTIDNSGAVGPALETKRAVDDLTGSVRQSGPAASASARESAAASRMAASAKRDEDQATLAAIKAIRLYGAEARAANAQAEKAARVASQGYAQLGMQINDVATQAAAGTAPALIFAQQANQMGFAMTMMGGSAAKVGGILAGPYGAAITMAVMGLGLLITNLRGGEGALKAQQKAAEEHQKAVEALDAATGRMNRTQEESIRVGVEHARKDLEGAIAARQRAQAELEKANAFLRAQEAMSAGSGGDPGARAGYAGGLAAAGLRVSLLEAEIASNKVAEATARAQLAHANYTSTLARVKGQLDPVVKATQNYEREQTRLRAAFEKGSISEAQLTNGLVKAEQNLTAAKDAASAADKAQGAVSREAKKAALDAQREAKKAAEEHAKLVKQLMDDIRRSQAELQTMMRGDGSYVGFLGRLNDADAAKKAGDQKSRDETGLAGVVTQAENSWDYKKQEAEIAKSGKKLGETASAELLRSAGAVGLAIGGEAGDILRTAAGMLEGLSTGDFRGVGGKAGGVMTLFAQGQDKGGWAEVTGKLDEIFGGSSGDGTFLKKFTGVLQSAAFGAGIASIVGKGAKEEQIGGAIGANVGKAAATAMGLPPGLGEFVGSILGTTIGGLFVKSKTGSVSLSGSGGAIVQGDPTGTGGTQVKNAGVLGNNFTNALNSIVDQLGGSIGSFSVSLAQNGKNYRVDTTGQGRTSKKQAGVLAFGEDANAAVQAALADAIRDGAVAGVSPRVQGVLKQYADNLDRAVAEALKVQNLENWIGDHENPFAGAFRDFERQAAERVRIARQYGFDVLQIEKLNAQDRAKLLQEQLTQSTAAAKQLLDDIRYGSRAEGAISERLVSLGDERARLQGLVDGGDTSQLDALLSIIQQQYDLRKEAYGSTGDFATGRGDTITTLEQLIKQQEDRVAAASSAAQNLTNDKLTELNTTADEQMTEAQRQTALLQQLVASLGSGGGSGNIADLFRRVQV